MDKRYLIIAGAFLTQSVIIGCMFAYGVYFTELEAEFGWSRTYLSAASSLGFLSMGLMAASVGQFNDRYGPRSVIIAAAVCTTLAYVLLSFIQQPWQLFFIYATLIGVGLAVHDVVTLSTVAKWFPRRKGAMSGVVKVGTALGQMTVPMLAVLLISTFGWRASLVWIGVGAGVLLLIASMLMGVKPATSGNTRHISESAGITFQVARRSVTLWVLCLVQLFFFGSLTTIPTHIVPHAIDSGFTSSAAAGVLMMIAASSVMGRLLIGFSFDRFGGKAIYLLCLTLLAVSLIFLYFINNPVLLYVFAVVYGFTHGGLFTMVSPTVAEHFGMREHGKIFGLIVFFGTIGGAVMPIVAGWLFDTQSSYSTAFMMLAAMAFTGLVLASLIPAHVAQTD